MSKISIKTDFADGEKLFAQQLNNNFLVIQAGINANEENLQQVIDQAVIELDRQLEEITANRGWDWNGGDRVTFFKGTTSQVNTQEIKNGQMLYNTETGETALDDSGTRIVTGSGNVVAISEEAPTNPATKEWIKPSKITNYAASYVTNSMSGSDIDKAPSVSAVKNYVDEVILYSDNQGTLGDITLSDSVSNYSYIEIFYNTTGYENSTKISGNKASLISHVTNASVSQTYLGFKNISLNGASLTVDSYQEWVNVWGSTDVTVGNDNRIYITKVVGYK